MDKGIVARATSADDSPPAGFLLTDIARMTVASYEACRQLEEMLMNRLKKNNHNVKYKVLVVIKHVCRNGRPEFKRDMARNIEPIKECLQYRGPPDALRGDEIYKRVRDAAREALDSLFESQIPAAPSAAMASNRIQGFGSAVVDESSGRTVTQSVLDTVTKVADRFRGSGDPSQSPYTSTSGVGNASYPSTGTYGSSQGSGSGGYGNSQGSGSGSSMPGFGSVDYREEKSMLQRAGDIIKKTAGSITSGIQDVRGAGAPPGTRASLTTPDYSFATNRGPTSISSSAYDTSSIAQPRIGNGSSVTGAWGHSVVTPTTIEYGTNVVPGTLGRVGGGTEDGAYEKSLVLGLCAGAGTRTTPPDDLLDSFLAQAITLKPELVGPPLLECVLGDSWQSRVKALVCVEKLVKTSGCEGHRDWWLDYCDEIAAYRDDPKSSVREKAVRVLRALGFTSEDASVNSQEARRPSFTSAVSYVQHDLLGEVEPGEQNPPTQSNTPVAAPDLFAGLNKKQEPEPVSAPSPAPTTVPAAPSDPFSGLDLTPPSTLPPTAPPKPPQPQPSTNMFKDLSVSDTAAPAIPNPVPVTSSASTYLSQLTQPPMPPVGMFAAPGPNMNPQVLQMQMQHLQMQMYQMQMLAQQQQMFGQMQQQSSTPIAGMYTGTATSNAGMLDPSVKRAIIPNADAVAYQTQSSSGFGFINGDGNGDSFAFVQEEMKKKDARAAASAAVPLVAMSSSPGPTGMYGGLLDPSVKRAIIPNAEAAHYQTQASQPTGTSGFGFINGEPRGDTFGFVQDELRKK